MKVRHKLAIGARILAARAGRRPRPFFVQYSLLNACNARCTYCNCPSRKDPQLTTGEHLRILGELARLGTVRVKFLGGEPLLRPDIGTLIARVNELGMRSAMVTNGFLVPEWIEAVRQLDELVLSIDGRREAHDRQRGRGSWERVMAAIEVASREGIDFFLSAVVTRESAGEIPWLLDLARRLGVKVNFQIPQTNGELYGPGAAAMLPDPGGIRAILQEILAAKEAGAPVLFSTGSYRHTLEWADFRRERIERPGEVSPCTAGRYFLQVEPNGDLYPCVLHIGSFRPKNALRDGTAAAWRHAQRHSCFDCYNTWLNENRRIFDLRPEVLWNFWRHYLPPRAGR